MFKLLRPAEKSLQQKDNEIFIPEKDSFLYRAFQENLDLAKEALEMPYIQGIKNGNLAPDTYGAFVVQDSFYCMHGADSLEIAYNNCVDAPDVKETLYQVHGAYANYADSVFRNEWHIPTEDSISINHYLRAYADYERFTAENDHSIFTLIALLPCYYLWSWIALEIKDYTPNNIYSGWIEENLDMHSSQRISDTIEAYRKDNSSFDEAYAMDKFRDSMIFEKTIFLAAAAFPSGSDK